ncbi:MAG: hypothetical protein QM831_05255 [Kofleriaceae bacterium]
MTRAWLLVAITACSDPTFTLRFGITDGQEAACLNSSGEQVTSCEQVTMSCRAAVSIRVFAPNDPNSPYISICKELSGQPDACSIASVDLMNPSTQVNAQTLEVSIAVYRADQLPTNDQGELQCPTGVQFDARGFPVQSIQPCVTNDLGECDPPPSIGGVSFWHPGDDEVVVNLGCTDLSTLNDPTCTGESSIPVTASVDDFDTEVSVQPALAPHLGVSIGEPIGITIGTDTHYQLSQEDNPLALTTQMPVPGWSGKVTPPFMSQCVLVREDAAATTAAVRCMPYSSVPPNVDITGIRLSKDSLAQILTAIGQASFPTDGLVVGIALDPFGNPMANVQVAPSDGSVQYLSADRTTVTGISTSTNGIFISKDAPFGTTFHATASNQSVTAFGGLIDEKVTVVILQFPPQTGM